MRRRVSGLWWLELAIVTAILALMLWMSVPWFRQ